MNDDPAKVYDAYKISKMARNTAIFNIVFSLFIKIVVMVLVMVGIDLPMFVAVLADTGLTVLMVINSLILLYRPVKRPIIQHST
jgi:cation transport ATPase